MIPMILTEDIKGGYSGFHYGKKGDRVFIINRSHIDAISGITWYQDTLIKVMNEKGDYFFVKQNQISNGISDKM